LVLAPVALAVSVTVAPEALAFTGEALSFWKAEASDEAIPESVPF